VEIFTGILMGIVAGLLVKALFLKDSHIGWDAIFGVIGGIAGFYLYSELSAEVTKAVFALGSGVLVAGLLQEAWRRFGSKTA
jgi:uncharacterized membrane protein YeaQ/YmgE (transglycosylase-associated protein family)